MWGFPGSPDRHTELSLRAPAHADKDSDEDWWYEGSEEDSEVDVDDLMSKFFKEPLNSG